MNKLDALKLHLENLQDIHVDDPIKEMNIEVSSYDASLFIVEDSEYLVLTDEEANERCRDYILENLWAFRANFLVSHIPLSGNFKMITQCIEDMQAKMCESCNELLLAMIRDTDELIEDAIQADGRGHFLSSYDSEEREEGEFFIYQIN